VGDLRISVIIASWNAARFLDPCLDSLATQQVRGGFETIVIDNASTDGTAELLRRRGEAVRIITNDHNAGFSAANNAGAEVARGDVLLFLNSDTELLAPDVLERLAEAAEQDDVGIVGPRLVNPDGTVQSSCAGHPSVTRALAVATGVHRVLPDRVRARIAPEGWSHDRSIDTGWVMGAALAIRASVFGEVGGFWSTTTMYAEDEEIAFKVQQRGLRVRYDTSIRVLHHGNGSNALRWTDAERAERIASAERAFLCQYYSRPRALAIRAIVGAGYAARALVHGLLGRRDRSAAFRAMASAYAGGSPPA
jgi:GT2 family glycosyltransferase